MVAPPGSAAALPPPDKLREELAALYKAVRITRSLLKLSERAHGTKSSKQPGPAGANYAAR